METRRGNDFFLRHLCNKNKNKWQRYIFFAILRVYKLLYEQKFKNLPTTLLEMLKLKNFMKPHDARMMEKWKSLFLSDSFYSIFNRSLTLNSLIIYCCKFQSSEEWSRERDQVFKEKFTTETISVKIFRSIFLIALPNLNPKELKL